MVAHAGEPVVACRGLTKVFKDFWMRPRVTAVDGIDLSVEPRQVFGLLGPNGSGKSTTIKTILGLLYPTKGQVAVFGRLPTDVGIKERIGYLPEESNLYRFLNARETLDFYGRLFRLPRVERQRRIGMLLEMVGLEAVQRRPIGEYSKGMQRRIGLAQALINDPDLLILDEPTSGLDPLGTRQIKDLILQLKQRGKTVLLCSHLLADVEDVCDRVTILYGGRVQAMGTLDELLAVGDSTLIETGALNEEALAKVRRVIEDDAKQPVRRVEVPRKKLETLFLEIVGRARQEGKTTSGAGSGGPVAAFLAGEAPGSSGKPADEGRAVIDKLVAPVDPIRDQQSHDEQSRDRQGAVPSAVQESTPTAPLPHGSAFAEASDHAKASADKRGSDAQAAPKVEGASDASSKKDPAKKPSGSSVNRDVIDALIKKDDDP